jgi:hypothetical protein
MRLYEASRTDEGVVDLFIEAGRALGLTTEQMGALFNVELEKPEEIDPDQPLTVAQFQEFQRQQQEAAQAAQRQAYVQQVKAEASRALHASVQEIGLDMQNPATPYVLQLGDKYLPKDQPPTPDAVRNAVQRGWADYQVLTQQAQAKYVGDKKAQAASVPGAPAGSGAPASAAEPEPKNVAEASERFWKSLGL